MIRKHTVSEHSGWRDSVKQLFGTADWLLLGRKTVSPIFWYSGYHPHSPSSFMDGCFINHQLESLESFPIRRKSIQYRMKYEIVLGKIHWLIDEMKLNPEKSWFWTGIPTREFPHDHNTNDKQLKSLQDRDQSYNALHYFPWDRTKNVPY